MDKLEKKHWIGAGLLGLGLSAVGLYYLYLGRKYHIAPQEKDIILVEMLKSAGLVPRKEKGPLSFNEYVAITKIKYTEMKKRLLPKCMEYEKQRIAHIKDGKHRSEAYQELVKDQVKFEEKVNAEIQQVLLEQLGLSIRDFSLAELKHGTSQGFFEAVQEVFDSPPGFTEEKVKEIFEDMTWKMEEEVKRVLEVEFKGDVEKMMEKYGNSMILETGVIDHKALFLGIDTWSMFQMLQKYNLSLSWVFEKLFSMA